MGCDIHIYTEALKKTYWNSQKFKTYWNSQKFKWKNIDHWVYTDYPEEEGLMKAVEIYKGRDYDLFSLLADVRNDGLILPIDEPRGLPVGVSRPVRLISADYGEDGHSHSWLLLKELKEAQDKLYERSGYISPEAAKEFDEKGTIPRMYCGWTSQKGWVKRTWSEELSGLNQIVETLEERKDETFFIIDPEKKEDYDDRIRIVFWFDN